MDIISSKHNPKIKWVCSLQTSSRSRRKENLFVVEGIRLVEEALGANWNIVSILYTEDLNQRGKKLIKEFVNRNILVNSVTTKIMQTVSDTETPQGILAVLEWKKTKLCEPLDFIMLVDCIRDPGNLGTMIRTAEAAGVQAMFTTPGTVDFLSPKVLRAAMGGHFHIPIASLDLEWIKELSSDLHFYLASVNEGVPYTNVDFRQPIAIIIGGEAEGASSDAYQLAEERIRIPMIGKTESLNAAIAAGILLFEVVRQRKSDKRDNKKVIV